MSDDEDETICPLCVEEMDLSDKNFLPCPCGYRVCMWCWHHIRENLNGLCPACRTPYNADPHAFSAVDRSEIVKKNKERRQKEKAEKKTDMSTKLSATQLAHQSNTAAGASGGSTNAPYITSSSGSSSKLVINSIADRRHLHNYRVVQRNLVYVIGVPASAATDEILRRPEYFGQYGKIAKLVIHRNAAQGGGGSVSAYVTFVHKDDAKAAIQALDGFWFDSHLLRASFGTTKYCNNFIRNVPCTNPDCVYLHDLGDDDDRFTKEEIQAGHSKLVPAPGTNQTIVTGNGGPSGTGKRPTSEPVFPAPVFIQELPSSAGRTVTSAAAPAADKSKQDAGGVGNRTTSWPSIADKLKEDLAKQEKERDQPGINDSNDSSGGVTYLASLRANTPETIATKDGKEFADGLGHMQPKEPVTLSTRSAKVAARKAEKEAKEQREKEARESKEAAKDQQKPGKEQTTKEITKDNEMKDQKLNDQTKKAGASNQEIGEEAQIAADEASNNVFLQSIMSNARMRTSKNDAPAGVQDGTSNSTLGSVSPLTVSSTTTARPAGTLPLPASSAPSQYHASPALPALHVQSPGLASVLSPALVAQLSAPPQVPTLCGPHKYSVFPLALSSLNAPMGVWTHILQCSNAHTDLSVNPYGKLYLSTHSGYAGTGCIFSELFDACLPPVDAVCLLFPHNEHHAHAHGYVQTVLGWPRPDTYYKRGCVLAQQADGSLSIQTHSVVVPNGSGHSGSLGGNVVNPMSADHNSQGGSGGPNNKPHSTTLHSLQQQQQQQQGSQVPSQFSLHTPMSAFTPTSEGLGSSAASSSTPAGVVETPNTATNQGQTPKSGGNAMAALQQMFPGVKMSFGVPKQAPKV